jgi:hypothetical protein
MSCRQYTTETKIFSIASQTATNSNSVLFINTGNTTVNVDGLILQPSQSWSIDGNENEILIKTYSFSFGAGTNPNLTVIYKRYL